VRISATAEDAVALPRVPFTDENRTVTAMRRTAAAARSTQRAALNHGERRAVARLYVDDRRLRRHVL
jgi:hypothetical protein